MLQICDVYELIWLFVPNGRSPYQNVKRWQRIKETVVENTFKFSAVMENGVIEERTRSMKSSTHNT